MKRPHDCTHQCKLIAAKYYDTSIRTINRFDSQLREYLMTRGTFPLDEQKSGKCLKLYIKERIRGLSLLAKR